jgi:hypothetical protein
MIKLRMVVIYTWSRYIVAHEICMTLVKQGVAVTMWTPSRPLSDPILNVTDWINNCDAVVVESESASASLWVRAECAYAQDRNVPIIYIKSANEIDATWLRYLSRTAILNRLIRQWISIKCWCDGVKGWAFGLVSIVHICIFLTLWRLLPGAQSFLAGIVISLILTVPFLLLSHYEDEESFGLVHSRVQLETITHAFECLSETFASTDAVGILDSQIRAFEEYDYAFGSLAFCGAANGLFWFGVHAICLVAQVLI